MKSFTYLFVILLIPALFFQKNVQSQSNDSETGSLVIVGGAMKSPEIFNEFLMLAGGEDALIILVPTAIADTVSLEMQKRQLEYLQSLGAKNVVVLHTKDRNKANQLSFYQPVLNATGVWFTGGRQWRIADSYLGTKTEEAFHQLFERGGVIGGSSAGATIQGSYLARGDTKTNTIMMGDHEDGFGFMPNTAIDQHLLKRNRQFDLIEIIEAKPQLLGIGIDENTAIIVNGHQFSVMGTGYVAIYDSNLIKEQSYGRFKFFLLTSGDVYDWKDRKVVHWSQPGRNIFR